MQVRRQSGRIACGARSTVIPAALASAHTTYDCRPRLRIGCQRYSSFHSWRS